MRKNLLALLFLIIGTELAIGQKPFFNEDLLNEVNQFYRKSFHQGRPNALDTVKVKVADFDNYVLYSLFNAITNEEPLKTGEDYEHGIYRFRTVFGWPVPPDYILIKANKNYMMLDMNNRRKLDEILTEMFGFFRENDIPEPLLSLYVDAIVRVYRLNAIDNKPELSLGIDDYLDILEEIRNPKEHDG